MIVHPHSNRSFWISLISIGLLISSIASFMLFFRTTSVAFIYALFIIFGLSLTSSILAIVYAQKAKSQIRKNPNQYGGKDKIVAGATIGIICLIINIIFALFVVLSFVIVANAFR